MCCSWRARHWARVRSLLQHPVAADCRLLFLREGWVDIGVRDFEESGERRVLINVEGSVPLALSTPQADELHELVDCDFIRRSIGERQARGPIHLQETLADDPLHPMRSHPRVRAARVSTDKPDVYPDCDAVGVAVFGVRAEPN